MDRDVVNVLRLICLCSLLISVAASSAGVWWLDFVYEPEADRGLGYSAHAFGEEIEAVHFFNCGEGSAFTREQCDDMREMGSAFEFEIDANKDGILEIWNVGVARTSRGQYYRLMVGRDAASHELLRVFKEKVKRPTFSNLGEYGDTIAWAGCLGCDSIFILRYGNTGWNLESPQMGPP